MGFLLVYRFRNLYELHLNTTHQLINDIVQDNNHIRYANFVFLKTIHSNSCIYTYSIKKLADKAKKSRTFIRQNVNFYLANGWCRMHGNNLIFNSNNTLKLFYEKNFNNKCTLHFKDIDNLKSDLYNKLLRNKKKTVDFIIQLKHDILHPKTLKGYKKAIQYFKRESRFCRENVKINDKFSISYRSLGELFNCSSAQAFNIIKKLVKNKSWMKKRNITLVLRQFTKNSFKSLNLGSNYFLFKGGLYYTDANNYIPIYNWSL